MLKNYLKVALRNLRKHRGYTFINVAGLAIGIACCLVILLHVRHELSYDRFHVNAERIFRIGEVFVPVAEGGQDFVTVSTPPPWASALESDFPEILETVRLYPIERKLVRYEDAAFYESRIAWSDSSVFGVFTFPLVTGDPATTLNRPNTAVLARSTSRKYFGQDNPVGKTLSIEGEGDFEVTAVMEDMPSNSHVRFDILLSMATLPWLEEEGLWISHFFYTYLLLPEGYDPAELERKLPGFIERHLGSELTVSLGSELHPFLQPLTEAHLHSAHFDADIAPQGDVRYVYVFSTIALFILVIACVNYVNLATARSAHRAKEVGMRKVLGAGRARLVRQFLAESVVLTLAALALAILLIEVLMPAFNSLTGQSLGIDYSRDGWVVFASVGAAVAVGILAGIYPALFLSGFRTVDVMKGAFGFGNAGRLFRKGLVVFQFAISIVLIIGTTLVLRQLEYVQNKKLGFEKEHVVTIPIQSDPLRERYESFRELALRQRGVLEVGAASNLPGKVLPGNLVQPEGLEPRSMRMLFVDHHFPEAIGMEVAEGRTFSEDYATDAESAFLLNEAAAREFGWAEPIGKEFAWVHPPHGAIKAGSVVGVVEDFHIKPLQEVIEPIVLFIRPERLAYAYVRIAPEETSTALAGLRRVWQAVYPDYPFDYAFLDDHLTNLYETERRLAKVFGAFAALAILIACLGLFGLAAFTAERRTKEIGVRKVLGASVAGIVALLSGEFVRLVLVAVLVAAPVGYFVIERWLENFAYRVEIEPSVFLLSSGAALLIALLTISYQAVKAALANPVKSLRYE